MYIKYLYVDTAVLRYESTFDQSKMKDYITHHCGVSFASMYIYEAKQGNNKQLNNIQNNRAALGGVLTHDSLHSRHEYSTN